MNQYLVVTEKGKLKNSTPPLPLSSEQIEQFNELALGHQWPYLTTLGLKFFDCQVLSNHIDWKNDIVPHILLQVE